MSAPMGASGGSSIPWKWRLAFGVLAVLALADAPGPTGAFATKLVHGIGSVGCDLGKVTCFTSTDQLNPLTQVRARVDAQP